MVPVKLVYQDDIRRSEVAPRTPLAALASLAQRTFSLAEPPVVKFVDPEGDLTTISNDADVDFAFQAAADAKKVLKIEVVVAAVPKREAQSAAKPLANEDVDDDVDDMYEKEDGAGATKTEPAEPAPEDPVAVLARFLSDKANVSALLDVFSSDAVAGSVAKLAQLYSHRSDDPLNCLSSAMDELAVLKAIIETSIDSKPEIAKTLSKFAEAIVSRVVAELRSSLVSEVFGGCGGGDSNSASGSSVHANVVCDSCDNDGEARRRSELAGTRDVASGCLKGIRYKSVSVRNYDLCESCEASRRFDSSHGPFVKIRQQGDCPPRPWKPRWGMQAGGGGAEHHGGGHGGHHHHGGGHGGHHHHGPHHGPNHHHHGGCDGNPSDACKFRRGCRGSRRAQGGANLKENLVEVASDFFERFRGRAQEFGGDLASAIEASLQDLAKEAERAKASAKTDNTEPLLPKATAPAEEPESDWVRPERVAAVDPMEKWADELSVLNRIGFAEDVEMALRMLEEEDGNLERVVARIASVRA